MQNKKKELSKFVFYLGKMEEKSSIIDFVES